MSAFSECCRQLLLESGSTVYQIAKQSGLDRTSIQRMITGKRMPSLQFVEKFCSHLRITPIERTEILELYKIEKIGKDLYQNRLYIKTMLESMNQKQTFDSVLTMEPLKKNDRIADSREIFTDSADETANLLEYVILEEIQKSSPSLLCTNLPVTYRTFFQFLQRIRPLLSRGLHLQHLFMLNKAPSLLAKADYNLEVLHEVLPFIAEFPNTYFPRYIYSKSTPGDDYYYIYPYYLISSENVLCISSDYRKAVLYRSEFIVAHYRSEFDRFYATSSPLATYHSSYSERSEHLAHTILSTGKPSHIASTDMPFVFPSLLTSLPRAKQYREAIPSGKAAHSKNNLSNEKAPLICFFAPQGAEKYFMKAEDSVEKKILLSNYLMKNKNNEFASYMFKNTFHFPQDLIVLLYDTRCIQFIFSPFEENASITISIEESSVCKSFLDFFNSMEESNLIHSEEETMNYLFCLLEKNEDAYAQKNT